MNVVGIESVYKDYTLGEQQVHALIDITFSIEDGSFLAIAGPSGSGKSTILNLIGCIDTPSRGKIHINGQDVSGKTPDQLADLRARTIGFIFQTFNLFPVLSAKENVEYPLLQLKEVDAAERRDRVSKYLGIVGLSKFANHRPNQLSGGQRQRVAIARALATQPKIVLADEPTANLDHDTGNGILQLMQEINREFKTTFVFSTHDQRVMAMADRLVHIEDGRLVNQDTQKNSMFGKSVREESAEVAPVATLVPKVASTVASAPPTAIREKMNNYLYIDHSSVYMTAPWHISTESDKWMVSRSSVEVGDVEEYIRKQLEAKVPFYVELHTIIVEARQHGIKVEGWPA